MGEGCESGPVGTQMTNSPTSQKNSEMRQATCKHIIAWWDEMGRVRKQSNQYAAESLFWSNREKVPIPPTKLRMVRAISQMGAWLKGTPVGMMPA